MFINKKSPENANEKYSDHNFPINLRSQENITNHNFSKKVRNLPEDHLQNFMNQIPDSQNPQINNQNFSSYQPMQRFPERNFQMQQNSFGQHPVNRFQNSGFVNSGDLLVQQFLLENIQKKKGRK